jgi:hypothetical protein
MSKFRSFLTFTSALSLANTWAESRQQREEQEQQQQPPQQTGQQTQQTMPHDHSETAEATQELVDIQRRNSPPPEAVPAYASRTITLNAGQQASVEYTPRKGYVFRVESIQFDRRDDHSYTFNVGGDTNSDTHQIRFNPPRRVSQGQPVVSEVENNQGSGSTTFDWEIEAWAIPTGVDSGV